MTHVLGPGFNCDEGHGATDPDGLRHPGEKGSDCCDHTAKRHLCPHVDATLFGEGTAGLGEDQSIRDHERDGQDERPSEGFPTEAGDLAQDLH